jgi:hypothetical protein
MTTRRLATILAADTVGCSRLMRADKTTVQARKDGRTHCPIKVDVRKRPR